MPGGRPRDPDKRSELVTTRLTPIELQIIERRAQILDISRSHYVSKAALGFMPYTRQPPRPAEIAQAAYSVIHGPRFLMTPADHAMLYEFLADSDWEQFLDSLRNALRNV